MSNIMIRLVMADGAEVRNIKQLQEHFDLEKVVDCDYKGYKNNRFTKRTKEEKVHCYRNKDGERVEKD